MKATPVKASWSTTTSGFDESVRKSLRVMNQMFGVWWMKMSAVTTTSARSDRPG